MTLTWQGPDRITAQWTSFEKGKKVGDTALELTRKK